MCLTRPRVALDNSAVGWGQSQLDWQISKQRGSMDCQILLILIFIKLYALLLFRVSRVLRNLIYFQHLTSLHTMDLYVYTNVTVRCVFKNEFPNTTSKCWVYKILVKGYTLQSSKLAFGNIFYLFKSWKYVLSRFSTSQGYILGQQKNPILPSLLVS